MILWVAEGWRGWVWPLLDHVLISYYRLYSRETYGRVGKFGWQVNNQTTPVVNYWFHSQEFCYCYTHYKRVGDWAVCLYSLILIMYINCYTVYVQLDMYCTSICIYKDYSSDWVYRNCTDGRQIYLWSLESHLPKAHLLFPPPPPTLPNYNAYINN